MSANTSEITVYGTSWCGDTRRARRLLDEHQIAYRWVDIDEDEKAGKFVESVARGFRSVPTIVWADGTILIEPSNEALAKKLGITLA